LNDKKRCRLDDRLNTSHRSELEELMFRNWFRNWLGNYDAPDRRPSGSADNAKGNSGVTQRSGPEQAAAEWQDQSSRKPAAAPSPTTFEEIYQTAAMKPPKLPYGILKVAQMAESAHLAGMPGEYKQRALLMALDAAGTDVGDVLNDGITRQRALREYEDSYLERVHQFEAARSEQNRLQKAELDRITSEFTARIQANLDEVDRAHKKFREWQKSKQQELHRLTNAAALCAPNERSEEEESDSRVMAIPHRPTGTHR
jgi:hypothetical protein